jgi:NAD(P)-dependent dehydrogenase (short-subunit alcohol dehydrogenase family)
MATWSASRRDAEIEGMTGFDKDLLRGKRVLITGGGTGLGKSMGERFAALGAELVICGRRKEVLDQTAAGFREQFGADVQALRCDVRSPDDVERMLDEIWRQAPLDVLVNNAAGNFVAQTHRLSARAIDSVLGICLHGTAYCTTGVGRRWIGQGRSGTVLSILTLSALQGGAFTVPSAMAKAGIDAMTKSLAVEWGPKGIRLVAVAPGSFPTEGATSRLSVGAGSSAADAGSALQRHGEHVELANLCAFLISDLAGYITGETVVIDGGRRYLGGARAGVAEMLSWSDEDWERRRAEMPARPAPAPSATG